MSLPHRKGYATVTEAMRSKVFVTTPGASLELNCPCGMVHIRKRVPVVPVKQRPGSLPGSGAASLNRTRLRPVSDKRRTENRERRKVVAELWPDGRPQCEWPGCVKLADDVHEKLSRARGGSITDRENLAALCRSHHDYVTFTPESELAEAYRLGLLVHSWDAQRNGGEAA